ncbi:MAG: hypothetical protein LUE11_12035, partial [Clostridia bacterium]|nr:hypothetical protein [Clostridia bacterium]
LQHGMMYYNIRQTNEQKKVSCPTRGPTQMWQTKSYLPSVVIPTVNLYISSFFFSPLFSNSFHFVKTPQSLE